MPWKNDDPAKRARDAQVYRDPEYLRNKPAVLRRARGRCEECGTRSRPLQVDHKIPVSQGGTHHLSNLQALCSGRGSCHARKTANDANAARRAAAPADPKPAPRTRWDDDAIPF